MKNQAVSAYSIPQKDFIKINFLKLQGKWPSYLDNYKGKGDLVMRELRYEIFLQSLIKKVKSNK